MGATNLTVTAGPYRTALAVGSSSHQHLLRQTSFVLNVANLTVFDYEVGVYRARATVLLGYNRHAMFSRACRVCLCCLCCFIALQPHATSA